MRPRTPDRLADPSHQPGHHWVPRGATSSSRTGAAPGVLSECFERTVRGAGALRSGRCQGRTLLAGIAWLGRVPGDGEEEKEEEMERTTGREGKRRRGEGGLVGWMGSGSRVLCADEEAEAGRRQGWGGQKSGLKEVTCASSFSSSSCASCPGCRLCMCV